MTCANNNLLQTNTNLNATANLSRSLCQPHTAANIGPTASVLSSSSVQTKSPTNHPPIITQKYTGLFVAMNKSSETFDGFDDQYTLEENIHQTDAHMIFTTAEESLDPVA